MTRDAEHTPFPQSVVVPIGVLNEAAGILDCEGYGPLSISLLSCLSAPAPSSLAGGEVAMDRDALIALIMEETTDDIIADGWGRLGKGNVLVQGCRYIRRNAPASPEGYKNPEASAKQFAGFIADRILAALSPEAPARIVGTIAHVSNGRSELAAQITAALTPRHEAPASDLTDIEAIAIEIADTVASPGLNWSVDDHCRSELHAHTVSSVVSILEGRHEAPAEGAGETEAIARAIDADALLEDSDGCIADPTRREKAMAAARRVLALRARSSAPEAREGEAVGHAGAMPGSSGFTMVAFKASAVPLGTALYTHPAAPSADKLRIAVEAMLPVARSNTRIGKAGAELRAHLDAIDQALAALKAEG